MLGCGASTGVPAIGPNWGECDPGRPAQPAPPGLALGRSRRQVAILIDTSPDLREQLIDARVRRLDAVLMTHAHADHLHGIDDLRQVNRLMSAAIPLWADGRTLAEIRRRFGYALEPPREPGRFYKPTLEPTRVRRPVCDTPACRWCRSRRTTGSARRSGFRIGPIAYSTDVTELDDAAFAALAGVELWVVDCMRSRAAPDPQPSRQDARLDRAGQARAAPS